ncbi:hypothetical protein JOY44_15035 [Phormidium sp. CLA17]|uniref:hypothetical protein n=1 Tax=Leptolyngbya sp. Cla-17 TaxID=2803751 RepID=UPI001492AAD9|nr:hypothetical protein [Leptolyngbya sp. Cla-17]MBM0742905.1 hypothetical protein [Leptolyngbya sp. Cla-17]
MQSSLFSPAFAVWNQRQVLQQKRDRLQALFHAVNDPDSLTLSQWVHLYAAVLEFKPDLVLELGRNVGNSTCAFTEAANQIGECRVVSLCRSTNWQESTQARVSQIVPAEWFQPLDARVADILQVEAKALLGNSQRVLVLWDAHGFDVAEYMLGSLMPLLKDRQHIVLVHDITDLRYHAGQESYGDKPLWRAGNDDVYSDHTVRVVLGHLSSAVEQAIALVDFTSRNHLPLHSADESFYSELSQEQNNVLRDLLGDELFSRNAHWFWFSLNETNESALIHFPKFTSPELDRHLNKPASSSHLNTDQLNAEVALLKSTIAGMESSKFWKIRLLWLKLKKLLGIHQT